MLTRLVLYAVLGWVLPVLGHEIWSAEFWCIIGLFWCADVVGRDSGFRNGVVQGMDTYRKMSTEQRADIDKILKDEQ